MMKHKSQILIIGSGLMSSAFLAGLFSTNCTSLNVTICGGLKSSFISKHQFVQNTLNLADYATHSVTSLGLARFWHSIIPTEHIFSSPNAQALFERWYGFSPVTTFDSVNTYFVPFLPFRPFRSAKNVNFLENDLVTHVDENVAYFTSGIVKRFDKIIFCCGALPALRILHASGYLPKPVNVSDHLNVFLGTSLKPYHDQVVHRNLKGYFKNYQLIQSEMVIERPAFRTKLETNSIRSENIYTNSFLGIISKLLTIKGALLIPEALHNKFGVFKRAPYTKYYTQILAKDLFTYSGENLEINRVQASAVLDKTNKILEQLPITRPMNTLSYLSGIHLSADISDFVFPENYFFTGGIGCKLTDSLHNSFKNAVEAFRLGEKIAK